MLKRPPTYAPACPGYRGNGTIGPAAAAAFGDSPMASPFPGMDPYIEAPGLWAGFHHEEAR